MNATFNDGNISTAFVPQGQGIETREQNDNLDHYFWIALSSVYIGHRNQGASFIGEFPREILPGKTPIRIASTKAMAPFELTAIAIEGDVNPLDKTLPDTDKHPNSRLERNSAFSLARFYKKEFDDYGVAVPDALIDATPDEVTEIFRVIFPATAMKELASKRVIENVTFEGVFLDQLRAYMRQEARNAIMSRVGVAQHFKEKCISVLDDLKVAAERGWSFANEKLNNTEKLIRQRQNGKPGKDWYDTPDSRFPHALPPLDLICLAETGRTPLDLKPLDATREMSESMGKSMIQGLREALAPSEEEKGAVMSLEDVKKLLDEQEAKHQAQIEEIKNLIGK